MSSLRWFALLAFCLPVVIGCGDGGGGHGRDLEGTWVNPAYATGGPPAKMVFAKNTLAFYEKPSDAAPYVTGHWAVEGEWAELEGRYFQCKLTYQNDNEAFYWLFRMFDIETLEAQVSADAYPETVSSVARDYGVWARQF